MKIHRRTSLVKATWGQGRRPQSPKIRKIEYELDLESFCSESDGNSGAHSETSSDSSSNNDSSASDATVGEGGIAENLDTLDLDRKKTENFTKFENGPQFRT